MVATLCRKCFLKTWILVQKPQNLVHFGPYDLLQNSPVCGPNTFK